MTESGRKRLCACGCGKNVTRGTEIRHQQGKGPATLASAILAQNRTLTGRIRKPESSRQSVQHQLVGRRAPVRNALGASCGHAGASGHAGAPERLTDDDYPMDDAGPSGVHHNTPTPPPIPYSPSISNALSAPCGLAGPSGHGAPDHFPDDYPTNDPGPSGVHHDTPMPYSPPPVPHSPPHRLRSEEGMPVVSNDVVTALSTTRRSQRVAERVHQIGRQRWGTNHAQYFTDERGDDLAEEEVAEDDLAGGESGDEGNIYVDEELSEEDDDIMAIAEPGQEGVSVWDLLGESFLQEASRIGMFSVECSGLLS